MDQTSRTSQLLNALRALGNDITYDPEHFPDGPTDAEVPHLLGALALMVDVMTAEEVEQPGCLEEFRSGYRSVSADPLSFARTLASRAAVTAGIVDVPELRGARSFRSFSVAVNVAADQLRDDLDL